MTERHSTAHFDDGWLRVDEAADPGFYIRFLDATRARGLELARRQPEVAFAHLALDPGLAVLDCGCGTGDMLAIMAGLIAPGEAVGGDLSATMVAEARRRAAAANAANLRFDVMDVQELPFPDGHFDRVLASQLLVHVPDPRRGLREMCRVTAPSGLLAIGDVDWDTLVVGSRHKTLARRFTALFSDGIRNGLVVREYAGWLRAEGFMNVQVLPQPMLFPTLAVAREWVVEPALRHFVAQGSLSADDARMLADDFAERDAQGAFFAAMTFYTITARRE